MRTADNLAWMGAVAMPAALVCGAVFSRLPEWFTGALCSTFAVGLTKKRDDEPAEPEPARPANSPDKPRAEGDAGALVDEMLAQGRYVLLLRPQLIGNLSNEQLVRAHGALAEHLCLVPQGKVTVRRAGDGFVESTERTPPPTVTVDAMYLDRYPVTNADFHQFLAGGGYEQMAIWHKEIWPAVLDFVDRTGYPGPRYWHKGRFLRGQENYPVVGVSWYEAAAYARWVGKRLPTDAEWVRAASWPVALPGQPPVQRRYPWGDTVDRTRANLWGSGAGRIVPVDQFAGGVSVGGVQQLIGNVWDWTADAFALEEASHAEDGGSPALKSIRGGAFDTYLDHQATCHFQSGDLALARKHNIGFRCAIGLCDIARRDASSETPVTDEPQKPLAETSA